MAIRQLILNSHYRSPLDFSDAALHAAQSGYDKITEAVVSVRKQIKNAPNGPIDDKAEKGLKKIKDKFNSAMDDDFNTAVALSVMFELVSLANEAIAKGASCETLVAIDNMFMRLGGDVLGIIKDKYEQQGEGNEEMLDKLIGLIIEQRKAAKGKKDYKTADALRKKLEEAGIVLEDKPDGTSWRIK